MATLQMWIGGNALAAPEHPGSGEFANASGVGWTDLIGLHQGWGATYRGREGKDNWFHCAIPTVANIDGSQATLKKVFLLYSTGPSVILRNVSFYDGPKSIGQVSVQTSGDHAGGTDDKNTFNLNSPIKFGVGISMLVSFLREDVFTFGGAGINVDV